MNWLAVQGGDKDGLLRRLGFRETGWVSNELRARLACAVLPNGWIVIVSSNYGLKLESLLPTASAEGFALGCEISEIVMYSSVRAYRDGQLAWAVTHDPDKNRDGLAVDGEPPPQFVDIRAGLARSSTAEPDESVDWWFDAPVELAKSICGYEAGVVPGVEWSTLAAATDRGPAVRARTLRDAIRAEIMPLLQSLGWRPGVGQAEWPNAFYSGSRIRDGRFQFVYLVGKDDGQETYLFPCFAAWSGEVNDGAPLIAGEFRAGRASVWTQLTEHWRRWIGRFGPDQRLDQTIVEARRAVLAMDEFLTLGRASPDLRIDLGSAQAWRAGLGTAGANSTDG